MISKGDKGQTLNRKNKTNKKKTEDNRVDSHPREFKMETR